MSFKFIPLLKKKSVTYQQYNG